MTKKVLNITISAEVARDLRRYMKRTKKINCSEVVEKAISYFLSDNLDPAKVDEWGRRYDRIPDDVGNFLRVKI